MGPFFFGLVGRIYGSKEKTFSLAKTATNASSNLFVKRWVVRVMSRWRTVFRSPEGSAPGAPMFHECLAKGMPADGRITGAWVRN